MPSRGHAAKATSPRRTSGLGEVSSASPGLRFPTPVRDGAVRPVGSARGVNSSSRHGPSGACAIHAIARSGIVFSRGGTPTVPRRRVALDGPDRAGLSCLPRGM
jgi:hypothetical protein